MSYPNLSQTYKYGQKGMSTPYSTWLAALVDPYNVGDTEACLHFECWLMWDKALWSDYRYFPKGRGYDRI